LSKRKIGARAHDFGRHTADALASVIKDAGFDCVQLAPAKAIEGINRIADIQIQHLVEINCAFARHGLEITVLGCYIEPSLTDKEKRLENVKLFCDNLHHAKYLNAKIVGTETTALDTNTPREEREKRYALLKDSLLRMAEAAEKTDRYIGIEPVAEHTLNTPELTRRLLDEIKSNKLKLIFDPANLLLPETIYEQNRIFNQMIHLSGDDIAVMHIKNIAVENGKKAWCKISEGVIDYTPLFNWLNKQKPEIPLLCDNVRMDSYQEDLDTLKKLASR
jgi:sugar phosphate isomerase/epimerase